MKTGLAIKVQFRLSQGVGKGLAFIGSSRAVSAAAYIQYTIHVLHVCTAIIVGQNTSCNSISLTTMADPSKRQL